MAITYVATSAVVSSGSTSTPAGTVATTAAVALPTGTTIGDRVFLAVTSTPPTATPPTPTGWTSVTSASLGTGTLAAAAGPRRVTVFMRDRDTTWTMPTVSITGSAPTIAAAAVTYRKDPADSWVAPAVASGSDTTTAVGYSVTGSTNPGITNGDHLFAVTATSDNVTATGQTLTATGALIGGLTERADGGNATGNDVSIKLHTALVTGGTATAAPVLGMTLSAASDGGTVFVRLRTQQNAKIATFTEDFADATDAAGKWTNHGVGGDHFVVSSGRLTGVATNAYPRDSTTTRYSLVESSVMWQVVQLPPKGNGSIQSSIELVDAAGGRFTVTHEAYNAPPLIDTVTVYRTPAGGAVVGILGFQYDAPSMDRFRIRETGGVIYLETSATGFSGTWTTQVTWTRDGTFDPTNVTFDFLVGYYGTETVTVPTIIDNINLPAATPPTPPAMPNTVSSRFVRTTAAGNDIFNYEVVTDTVTGGLTTAQKQAFVYVPEGADAASAMKFVVYCHGLGDDASTFAERPGITLPLLDKLMDAGYVVIVPTYEATFGNADAQLRTSRAYNYLKAKWTETGTVMFGFSMGGGTAAVAAHKGTIPSLRGVQLVAPAVEWSFIAADPATYVTESAAIFAAYNTDQAGFEAAVADWEPTSVSPTLYAGIRFRAQTSAEDGYTQIRPDTTAWLTSIAPYAAQATDVEVVGAHGSAGEFADPAAMVSFFDTAIASAPADGAATGSWSFAGTAAGKRTAKATAVGSFSFAGSATGKRVAKATGSGTFTFAGTAAGKRVAKAAATGSWSFTGTASGKRIAGGTATGTATFTGTASGKRTPRATATGTATFTGTATGTTPRRGTATGSWTFTGTAAGTSTRRASASGTWAFSGTAAGSTTKRGTATGTVTYTGTASGSAPLVGVNDGSATGAWSFTGTATGRRTPRATANGSLTWAGSATGTAPVVGAKSGTATGSITWTGSAVGRRVPKATATGATAWAGTATGSAPLVGSAAGTATSTTVWAGVAAGRRTPKASATGVWAYTGTARGPESGLRDIVLSIGPGRSRGLAASGRSRTLTARPRE